jgi:hypothetical protein
MTIAEIAQYRLYHQQIIHSQEKEVAAVVKRLVAVQAQDFASARWAVGLRTPGATDSDIEKAIAERKIVRTWPMRGTLHFLAAADVRWILPLLTPRIIAGSSSRHTQLGLDDATFALSREIFTAALQGGKQLQRDAMYQVLEEGGIRMDNQRGYHLLWRNAQEGLLCFGPTEGKQPTFVLMDEWIPAEKEAKQRERTDALAELALRYFLGHGPATVQDFCWWSGLTATDAKAGLEAVRSQLAQAVVDGKTYWMAPGTPEAVAEAAKEKAPRVHLLPGFDEYLLGYRDRSAVLDPQYAQRIVPGSNGVFLPTLVIEGRVAGTWKRAAKKKSVQINAQPFAPLSADEESAFWEAAQRYGDFIGLPVEKG